MPHSAAICISIGVRCKSNEMKLLIRNSCHAFLICVNQPKDEQASWNERENILYLYRDKGMDIDRYDVHRFYVKKRDMS